MYFIRTSISCEARGFHGCEDVHLCFLSLTSCGLFRRHRRFGATYYLDLQLWRDYVSPKNLSSSRNPNSVTTKKTKINIDSFFVHQELRRIILTHLFLNLQSITVRFIFPSGVQFLLVPCFVSSSYSFYFCVSSIVFILVVSTLNTLRSPEVCIPLVIYPCDIQ